MSSLTAAQDVGVVYLSINSLAILTMLVITGGISFGCSKKGDDEEEEGTGDGGNQGVSDDGSKLAISLDVSKFKPDELKVNIDGRTLTVEGKQEVKEGSCFTARSFTRQWTVPEGVDVEQIRSTLTENGHLAIEVPKSQPAITSRSIPIQKAVDQPTVKSS